jgi:outer membrane protein TolC
MNFMRKYLLIFILLGSIIDGYCQVNNSTIKLSIPEAKTFAIQNNRYIQAARIDIKTADKQVWETIATGLPQINADANYLHQFVVPELSFGPYLDLNELPDGVPLYKDDIQNAYKNSPAIPLGVKNNTTINLTLSQLIFNGEYLVGLQASRVFKQLSEKSLVKTEDMTKESVESTYCLVLVLGENVKVLKNSLKYTEKTYDEMVKMNEQGFNEETDVDQMKISRSNIQTLITSLESQKEISMKLLKFQLGVDFSQTIVLTDSLPGILEAGSMQYLAPPEYDVNKSIDYQLIIDQVQVSSLLLKREKSKVLPSLAAFYRHQEQTNQPSFNFAVKDVIGATLSVPILSSGMRASRIDQAKFNLEKSLLAKDNTEQGLIMDYETAKSNFVTAYSNYMTNKESMMLSKKVYDKTVIKYQEGVSTSLDLTQNINQFLTSQQLYYNAILSLLNAKAKLDRILGIN